MKTTKTTTTPLNRLRRRATGAAVEIVSGAGAATEIAAPSLFAQAYPARKASCGAERCCSCASSSGVRGMFIVGAHDGFLHCTGVAP